ncbi:MAG: YhfC family glutamic-type intramembrane protease [Anaerolineales bacterium]
MYSLDVLLLFAIPIAFGIFLARRFNLEGKWWWIGGIVYVVSQVIIQPLENNLINPYLNNLSNSGALPAMEVLIFGGLILGLSVGVCEELLRYGMLRWWAKDARSFESGLLLGTGAGGAASIILASLVFYNFINMSMIRNRDLTTLIPADQLQVIQSQITAFWSAPWYYALHEAVGQVFMIAIEICLAVMVMQTFTRKQWYWVLLAAGFHTLVEGARVITLNLSNETMTNAVLGVFAIFSVMIILALRPKAAPTSSNSFVKAAPPNQVSK